MLNWLEIGEKISGLDPSSLRLEAAKATLKACIKIPNFHVLELRVVELANGRFAEILIADCINDHVQSANQHGIKVREPLALVFNSNPEAAPEVYALREDFPRVNHLNALPGAIDASICLYLEPWSTTQRRWTPEKHLQRILWWLLATSHGRLHQEDQPLELPLLQGGMTLVLPGNLDEEIKDPGKAFMVGRVEEDLTEVTYLHAIFLRKDDPDLAGRKIVSFLVETDCIAHSGPEWIPATLGQLVTTLEAKGARFLESLRQQIWDRAEDPEIQTDPSRPVILVLKIPISRAQGGPVERVDIRAFAFGDHCNISTLGSRLRVLYTHTDDKKKRVYRDYDATRMHPLPPKDQWVDIKVDQLEVKLSPTLAMARRNSRLEESKCLFNGIQAGVGALGSLLAEFWAKSGWGEWTLVDPDRLAPHNVLRHIGNHFEIGQKKVDIVGAICRAIFAPGVNRVRTIFGRVNDQNIPEVSDAISRATICIDCTTTLDAPRDLALFDGPCRVLSAFITPSGEASVLLAEDLARQNRIDAIEAQYYRALLKNDLGKTHLKNPHKPLWVGAGCREISVSMPHHTIAQHAGLLANRIQRAVDCEEPCIHVFTIHGEDGEVGSAPFLVKEVFRSPSGGWEVVWDSGIKESLFHIREDHLPNETGGVILGYSDHVSKRIYIVDVLDAPLDSDASRYGFTRGILGLKDMVEEASTRTVGIVTNVGEWHSHPPACSPRPSALDREQIRILSEDFGRDGEPALMLIVGEREISITVLER